MGSDYKQYLAAQILSDGNIVTYRLLSRALKVQSNAAKKMLFEFHRQQNAKKPKSVFATYLVTGIQEIDASELPVKAIDGDGDVPMQSSPYMSSPAPPQSLQEEPLKQRVITLVKEEHLDVVKQRYPELSSIHVYSLGPSTIKNLQILSNVTQQIVTDYIREDPLVHNKTYGIIQNPNAKRRTGARPPPPTLPTKAPSRAMQSIKDEASPAISKESSPAPAVVAKTKKEAGQEVAAEQKKPGKPAPVPIKREKSDLFKAFAKSQPKVKREETGSSSASRSASRPETPNEQKDVNMGDVSDDEEEDEEPVVSKKQESNALREAKTAREAKLRQMMEEDEDEDMKDASEGKDEQEEADEEAVESKPVESQKTQPEDEQPTVTVSGGRRRGRRKVMKKKTTRDAEGYLVTKEEPAWESFSEEEPAPPPKPKSLPSSSAAKGKTSSSKPGQGNIKNFFARK